MKKHFFRYIVCAVLLTSLLVTVVHAHGAENWYICKKGNQCPGFPGSADYLRENGCYFVDDNAVSCGEKRLYLTFDAGYENGNIELILNTLKEESVPGAFFILSNLINKNTDLVKRMAEEGHLVCNHTANHKDLTTLSKDEIKQNLQKLESLYFEKTGHSMPKYFRYPEGRYSKETVQYLDELGYKTFFWSMAYADWDNNRQPSEESAIRTLLSHTHPGAIILLHPTSATNAHILPKLIETWKSMGYTFGSLDELVNK